MDLSQNPQFDPPSRKRKAVLDPDGLPLFVLIATEQFSSTAYLQMIVFWLQIDDAIDKRDEAPSAVYVGFGEKVDSVIGDDARGVVQHSIDNEESPYLVELLQPSSIDFLEAMEVFGRHPTAREHGPFNDMLIIKIAPYPARF